MPAHGSTVIGSAGDGDLELAGQEGELRVQGAPLAHDFGKRAGVGNLIHRYTGQLVAGDVADAVAAGLDTVHVHGGQQVHHVGAFGQGNPVELHVLAGGEVAVAHGQVGGAPSGLGADGLVKHLFAGVVVFAGNAGQHAQLGAGELAVRHCYTQHGCVALDVPAVLQAQGAEFFVTQSAGLVAFQLVAVLGRAGADELAVKFGVLVHRQGSAKNQSAMSFKPA